MVRLAKQTPTYSFDMKHSSLNMKFDILFAVSIRSKYLHQSISSYRNGRHGIYFQFRFNENRERISHLYSVTLIRFSMMWRKKNSDELRLDVFSYRSLFIWSIIFQIYYWIIDFYVFCLSRFICISRALIKLRLKWL